MNKNFDDFLAEYIDRIRDLCKTEDEVFTDYYKDQASLIIDILRLYHEWQSSHDH